MVANAIQKRVAVALETGTLQAPAVIDYDAIPAPGGLLAVNGFDEAALKRAYVDNARVPRTAEEEPEMLAALRNASTETLPWYLSGHTSGHAAAGAQATRDLIDMVVRAGWGGEDIGYSADITGGSATAVEVTEGEGAPLEEFSWGYFWDADGGPNGTGQGYFRQIASVTPGAASPDILNMAPDHDLPFTPAPGDRVYAVIAHYPDFDIMEDHTDAGNELLRVFLQGRDPDDKFELFGAKPEIQIGPIEQGNRTEIQMNLMMAYFEHSEVAVSPALTQQLQGSPGKTVGAGCTTLAYLSNPGTALANQNFWGAITITTGITPEQVDGPNGCEGVHGYGLTADSYKGTRLEVVVPFAVQNRTDAEARQHKRFMVQVGNLVTDGPYAVYCPYMQWSDDAETGADDNSRRQQTLRFQCLQAPFEGETGAIDTTGLSAAEVRRARAKIMILRVA